MANKVDGVVSPGGFAVLRLIESSNLETDQRGSLPTGAAQDGVSSLELEVEGEAGLHHRGGV